MKRIALLAFLAACSSSAGPTLDRAKVGEYTIGVPQGWHDRDLSDHYTERIEWRAPDGDEPQSIVVVRSASRPAQIKAGRAEAERLLVEAQRALLGGHFSTPSGLVTHQGFVGVEIEGDFVPPGKAEPVHRIHAVMLDSLTNAFIHILYTAKNSDRDVFTAVADSLQRGA